MKDLQHLNKYFIKYRWHLLLGIVFVFVSNIFRVLQPKIVRQALDMVVENISLFQMFDGFESQATLYREMGKTLLFFGLLVIVLALMMGIFMYFMRQTIIVMSRLIEYDLRKEVFAHYEKLDRAFYKKNNTGDLMSRVTEDVNKVRMYLGPGVLYAINLVSLFIMVISSMLSVSVELTLYTLAPLPILSISIFYVSNLINKKSTVIQTQLARLNSIAQEVFSGIRVVKSYVQEDPQAKHFSDEANIYKDNSMELAKVNALFFPVMLFLIGASNIIVVYVGGLQVINGNITAGNIAEFVLYVNMLTWPVTALGWIASIVQQAAASQKRINEFLKLEPMISNPVKVKTEKELQGDIQFEDVSFVYPDTGINALKNVSFHLKSGEKMAIIGRTGSGKSTIADLLVRLYDVTQGQILIDDKNIKSLDLANLRSKIGYVPQDVFLFSDTVAGNIKFGKDTATQSEIETYARHAAVYEDIKSLPQDFKTMVGERGVTLSGGQKQRVSIARAFIKDPDIVLLDDCLSAVDTNTEQQILGYLNDALADKTAIIITHRIYGLLDFDQIIVLDDGKIIESGTHESLLSQNGYYAELFELQQRERED
ncbi:MAG: ABC transporter ATP-binding protein [Saprospiraceae bacterium]